MKKAKALLKRILPSTIWNLLVRARAQARISVIRILNRRGWNVDEISYASPLPVVSELQRNTARWFRPSQLAGIPLDIECMKSLLVDLVSNYASEYGALPSYDRNLAAGFGPGYPAIDAMMLYFMLRSHKPRNYIEVGSGLSTYYCSLAGKRNEEMGRPVAITCIEPFPYKALGSIPGIRIINKEVQDIETSFFEQGLDDGDMLFIDSSHIVRIDGDVPYLYLEVLPKLKRGVIIHVHDVPFPYNVPYPPSYWIFKQQWPRFWNEAMMLQSFMCYNSAFKVIASLPLLRYVDESFLRATIPEYDLVCSKQSPITFSSIWIEKTE